MEALGGSATLIAEEIRRRIWQERQLTASAGVAPNKFLAKVASDWNKPNGLYVIKPEDVESFIQELPIERIWGIGHVSAQRLHQLNIRSCGELQKLDLQILEKHFGNRAWSLYELCRGIDHRSVAVDRMRKSLSVEATFSQDLFSLEACLEQVPSLYQRLMARYAKISHQYASKKPFIKLKFNDFSSTTVESSLYTQCDTISYSALLRIGWERKKQPVRLIGLGIHLAQSEDVQLRLF